ncbi:MAG: bile acid:sodium symporter family protein [Acidobacteriota bacterium]
MSIDNISASDIYAVALATMMFSMGLTLKVKDFIGIFVEPKAVGLGLAGQLLFLPLIAFGLVAVLPLPPEAAIGLIILSACPGGVTSNGIVYAVRADVALSITLTATASLITVFTLPLIVSYGLVHVFGESTDLQLPLLNTMRSLFMITVLPVSVGMTINRFLPKLKKAIEKIFRWITIVFLIGIITHGTFSNINALADQILLIVIASILLVCITMGLGYGSSRLFSFSKKQGITISVEIGVQNVAMSFLIAGTYLGRPDFTTLPAIYGVCMFVITAMFLIMMRKRASL